MPIMRIANLALFAICRLASISRLASFMSKRTDQVASLLQKEVGNMIAALELPALTTISKIEVTPDLKWGKIGITILATNPEMEKGVLEVLDEHIFEIQRSLNRKLKMKIVPRIKFVIDKGEEYADRINALLREAHDDEATT